jgi:cobalt-zinc-cadmium efflux system membrane fusion protein
MKNAWLVLVLSLSLASCSREREVVPAPPSDPGLAVMPADAQANAGVKAAPASVMELADYLHVFGTVQPIDSRIGDVRPLARGRVQEVLVRVGDQVTRGQPLARLDNIEAGELAAEALAARADLQKLKVQHATAARQVERSRSLAEIGAIARKDLELTQAEFEATAEAVKAQESLLAGLESKLRRLGLPEAQLQTSSITTIDSPFAGVVVRAQAAPGDVVDPAATLFSITDLSEVWVQAEVYERDLGRIQLGQPARISVEAYPGEIFSGAVTHISDTLDPKTRTAMVRCVVPNGDRRLKVDMLAGVDVPTTVARQGLAVPTAAVQQLRGKTVVFVRESEQTFRVRDVTPGLVTDGLTEIVDGLREGEPVVVAGAYHLKSVLTIAELEE